MNNPYIARPFQAEDHATLSKWWVAHKWMPLPLVSLPQNGMIIESDGVPLVAGFVYRTDSDIALMEWIISNPESMPIQRARALDVLIDELIKLAKAGGARLVLTFFRHDRLKERAKAHGFIETDQNMTHLMKEI